jgi:hypothetical protein
MSLMREVRAAGGVLVAALLAAGLVSCDARAPSPSAGALTQPSPSPAATDEGASPSPTPSASPSQAPSPPTVHVGTLSGTSPNDTGPGAYRYQVEYPRLDGLGGGREVTLDTAMQGTLQREVYDFVDAARAAPMGPTRSELDCHSRTVRLTGRLAVLRVDCTEYQAGAAHPTTTTTTFNCDLDGGRVLALQDLFGIGSTYLTVLSDAARDQLTRLHVADEQTLVDGTAPVAANFRDFLLTQAALVVVFARYQVAPGTAGQPEVSVPYQALDPYLAPRVRELVAA